MDLNQVNVISRPDSDGMFAFLGSDPLSEIFYYPGAYPNRPRTKALDKMGTDNAPLQRPYTHKTFKRTPQELPEYIRSPRRPISHYYNCVVLGLTSANATENLVIAFSCCHNFQSHYVLQSFNYGITCSPVSVARYKFMISGYYLLSSRRYKIQSYNCSIRLGV